MLSNNTGQGPKDMLKILLKDVMYSKVLLRVLADSLNDQKFNKLVEPTNQNIDRIFQYIDDLPEKKLIDSIVAVQQIVMQFRQG